MPQLGAAACSGGGPENAWISVEPSGAVLVAIGTQSNGQGHETAYAQVTADRLGIDIESVSVVHGDTDKVQFGMGTYGSRSGAVGMSAIAAGDLDAGAVEVGDAQGATRHIGDLACRGIGPGVEHRPLHLEWAGLSAQQAGDEQAPSECEGAHRDRSVGGETGDAGSGLAGAFAAGAFLGGKVVGVVVAEQYCRVAHQSFITCCGVEHPESVDGVVAGGAAQKNNPFAIR